MSPTGDTDKYESARCNICGTGPTEERGGDMHVLQDFEGELDKTIAGLWWGG